LSLINNKTGIKITLYTQLP